MKRRLSLARALVNDPQLLLLDEPTTGLDPQARHLMWERLQLLLQQGKSILLTTHFMDEAERLCSRLLVLDHGRKIAEGRPRELIAQHLEPEVVEVYGPARWRCTAPTRRPARAGRAGGGQRRDGVLLHRRTRAAAGRRWRPCRCAPCTGRPTWKTCSSNSPAARSARTAEPTGTPGTGHPAEPCPRRPRSHPSSAPDLSMRWWPVFLRNLLVWRKLAMPSLVGNIAEPLMWLVAFRLRHGRAGGARCTLATPQGAVAVPYILFLASGSICMSAMNAATFEALYSAFSRMHVQKTWDGIMNAPVRLDDVVLAEMLWAAFKALFTVTAILLVMLALGISHSPKLLLAWPVLLGWWASPSRASRWCSTRWPRATTSSPTTSRCSSRP
jgi:hypothetical protein